MHWSYVFLTLTPLYMLIWIIRALGSCHSIFREKRCAVMTGAISFSQLIDQSNGSQSISTAVLTNFCTSVCHFKFMAFCKTQNMLRLICSTTLSCYLMKIKNVMFESFMKFTPWVICHIHIYVTQLYSMTALKSGGFMVVLWAIYRQCWEAINLHPEP